MSEEVKENTRENAADKASQKKHRQKYIREVLFIAGLDVVGTLRDSFRKKQERAMQDRKYREEFLRYAEDEEVLTYLSNASLEFPLDDTATNIMLYLATKLYGDVPEDIRLESLSEYEEYELKRMRERIRQRQWRDFEEWFLSVKKSFKEG